LGGLKLLLLLGDAFSGFSLGGVGKGCGLGGTGDLSFGAPEGLGLNSFKGEVVGADLGDLGIEGSDGFSNGANVVVTSVKLSFGLEELLVGLLTKSALLSEGLLRTSIFKA